MRTARERRSRVLALLGCVSVVATFVAYSLMLQQQANVDGTRPDGLFGNLQGAPTWLLGLFAASAAANATATRLRSGPRRRLLLVGNALMLTVVGVVGIFSIGLPLLIAAAMTVGAAAHDAHEGEHGGPRADRSARRRPHRSA